MPIMLVADLGEGLADDEALLPHLDAANIASGAQALDPAQTLHTLRLCAAAGVASGAHPSHIGSPALGRHVALMDPAAIAGELRAQLAALLELAASVPIPVTHLALHGALNQLAATDPGIADAIARDVTARFPGLALIGPSGSELIMAGRRARIPVLNEVMVDRRYEADGTLRGRGLPGALLNPAESAAQALSLIRHSCVLTHDSTRLYLDADVLRISSDIPGATARAYAVRKTLLGLRSQ